jgi:hypothetical protein
MTIYSGTFSVTSNYPNPGNWTGSLSFNLQPDGFGDFVGKGTIKVSYVDTASIPITPNFTASDTEQVIGYTNVAAGYDEFMPNFYPGACTGEFDGNFTNSTDSTITGTLILTYAPTDNTFETKVTLYGQPSLPPVISFDSGSLEINANAGVATYTLSRSFVPLGDLGSTVYVSTRNGTAVAGRDYGAINDKAVIFGPGQTTATFTVPISADAADAKAGINPDFEVVLSNPVNASIGLGTADTTILETSLTVNNIRSATRGQVIPLSSLVAILDPSNAGYQQLELWDSNGTAATGQFVVNGVPQSGGHEIDVSPANVANTVYDVGILGGTDTVSARLKQNGGTLTPWEKFTVTAPAAQLPTLAVHNDANATRGQVVNLSTLVTISDPDHVGYRQLVLWDSAGTVGGGQFIVNGAAQSGGHDINVSPANVANTVFDVGTLGGTDTLWARLVQDNGQVSGWQKFTVTAPAATPPTVTASDVTLSKGDTLVAASTLFSASDADGVAITQYGFWDTGAGGGHFVLNDNAEPINQEIDVTASQLSSLQYQAGAGTDTLRVRASDGEWGPWSQAFTVTGPINKPPIVNGANITTVAGQPFPTTFVSASDPDGDTITQYGVWETGNGGAQFLLNNRAISDKTTVVLSAAQFSEASYKSGSGSDTLWVRAFDGAQWGPWAAFHFTTNVDPTLITAGERLELATYFFGSITFASSTGTLQLDNAPSFSGTVTGMTGQDAIDLRDINYASVQTPRYSGTSSGGTLTVTDGTHTANIALLGNYLSSTFVPSSDGHGGTNIVDPQLEGHATPLAQPQHA